MSSSYTPLMKENEVYIEAEKTSVPQIETIRQRNFQLDQLQSKNKVTIQENKIEFLQFVAREARFEEEYWTAAWLRAESHWEAGENNRYANNYKRKFAEQEFNSMKRRYKAELGEKCTCIVMVKKGDDTVHCAVPKCVVGTLDLSIRHLSHGETFPEVKSWLFCLADGNSTSRYGYIANLCVAKSARRQGIASNMLHYAITSAKAQGAENMFVHVHRNNIPAQRLYQNMGFEVVEEASVQSPADQIYLLHCQASSYLRQSLTI